MSGCGAEHGLISVDQALKLIVEKTRALSVESIPLQQALNFIWLKMSTHRSISLIFTKCGGWLCNLCKG